ncbi:MAG: DsbA family protein [Nitrososphaeraceae archaeon]
MLSFSMITVLIGNASAQWTVPSEQTAKEEIKYNTFENSDSSIKVDYPEGWKFSEISASDIEFHPQLENASNTFIKLTVIPLTTEIKSIQSIVDATLKNKAENLEDFILLDSAPIPNSKVSTHKLIYTYANQNNARINQLDYGTLNNDKLYLLSFVASPKEFYDFVDVADRMMFSLSQHLEQEAVSKFVPELLTPVSDIVQPLGDPNSKITLVEFADYRCPFCDKFHKESFEKLKTNFIDTGIIKYIFKDFVVNDRGQYKGSAQAAMATYCAAEQGKYWELSSEIYKNFKPEPQHWITLDSLTQFANNVQIQDIEKFKECVESKKYESEVEANKLLATNLGLTGTPSFVILNGDKIQTIMPGAVPYQIFETTFRALQAQQVQQ